MTKLILFLSLSSWLAYPCKMTNLGAQQKVLSAALKQLERDGVQLQGLRKVVFLGDGHANMRIIYRTSKGVQNKLFSPKIAANCSVKF